MLPPKGTVVMESTGRYHLRWARCLARAGHHVYVLNALLAKRLIGSDNALRQNKTDKIDARQLADIGHREIASLERFRFREDIALSRLRELCKVRKQQRALLTEVLAMAAHSLGMILPEADPLALRFARNRALAELFIAARVLQHLRGMRRATLEQRLGATGIALHQLLRQPLSAADSFDALLPCLQAHLKLIIVLRDQLLELDAHIREALELSGRKKQAELVQSIPGFGEKTIPAIVASLPEGWEHWDTRRKNANKLQAMFGFDPRLRQSGKWEGKVKMTKRGTELARTAFFQVAVCSLRHDPQMREMYRRQRAAGKHHGVALSNIMRRQLRRMVAVLTDQKPFVHHNLLAAA